MWLSTRSPGYVYMISREIKHRVYGKRQREFVPRDPVFNLLSFTVLLLFIITTRNLVPRVGENPGNEVEQHENR